MNGMAGSPGAAQWLAAWERAAALPAALQPCALLAPLLPPDQPGAEQWPLGVRDAALLDLHAALFGTALTAAAPCPACREALDIELQTTQLRVPPPAPAAAEADPGRLSVGEWQLQWRLPTSRDLATAALAQDEAGARAALLHCCVSGIRHAGREADHGALPAPVVDALAQAVAQADPQALIELQLNCPACGHGWSEVFDIGGFLVARVAHWAAQTLDQVHLLARAYGWTEDETLRLSPARRSQYIERVLA